MIAYLIVNEGRTHTYRLTVYTKMKVKIIPKTVVRLAKSLK